MPAARDLPLAGQPAKLASPDPASQHAPRDARNADHREREAQLSEARERVNRALTEEFDERSIVVNLLTEAMNALGADSGVVATLQRGSLQPRHASGLPSGAQSAAIDVGERTTPRLWKMLNSDEPSWHDRVDAPDSPLAPLLGDGFGRATLLIPLIHAARPMGAVCLTYHTPMRNLLPRGDLLRPQDRGSDLDRDRQRAALPGPAPHRRDAAVGVHPSAAAHRGARTGHRVTPGL